MGLCHFQSFWLSRSMVGGAQETAFLTGSQLRLLVLWLLWGPWLRCSAFTRCKASDLEASKLPSYPPISMFTLSIFHFLSSLPMVARVIILKSEPAQIGFELGYPSSQNSSESFCCSWGKIHCSLPHSPTCIPRLGLSYLLYQPQLKARFALFFHPSLSHLGPYIAAQVPGMLFCWFYGCPTPAVPSGPSVEGPFTERLSLTPTSIRTPCYTSRVSNSALPGSLEKSDGQC